jgi:ribosome-associated protein
MRATDSNRSIAIEPLETAQAAREALEEKNGREIVLLDVREISNLTDFFLIATGGNRPHLKALAEGVRLKLKGAGVRPYGRSGTPESDWIVLDYLDVVVHLLSGKAREYYALEKLWSEAPRVRRRSRPHPS